MLKHLPDMCVHRYFTFVFHSNTLIDALNHFKYIYCESLSHGGPSASCCWFNVGTICPNICRAHTHAHTAKCITDTAHVLTRGGGQWCTARVVGARRDLTLSLFILFKRIQLFSSKLKFETNCRLRAKRPPWRKEHWHLTCRPTV